MCRFTVTCGSPRQRRRNAGGFGACTPFGVKQQHNTRASCLCKQSFRICSARRMVQPSRQRCVDRLSGAGAKARGTLEALRCASLSACNTSTTPGHRVCANAASASALDSQRHAGQGLGCDVPFHRHMWQPAPKAEECRRLRCVHAFWCQTAAQH